MSIYLVWISLLPGRARAVAIGMKSLLAAPPDWPVKSDFFEAGDKH